MLKADKAQKQRIAILVKGDKDLKKALVQQTTGNESKTSTNDLTHAQANRIIQHLGGKPIVYENWAYFDNNKASHRQMLSLCMQYGWSTPHPTRGEIANLGALSEWLKSKRSPVNKKLQDMTPNEVSKIITALEGMVKSKYKS
jgi:hypothetical protein